MSLFSNTSSFSKLENIAYKETIFHNYSAVLMFKNITEYEIDAHIFVVGPTYRKQFKMMLITFSDFCYTV